MPPITQRLILILIVSSFLSGCAAVAVGGAATGVAVVHDRRTAGTVIDDQTIELTALRVIYGTKNIRNNTHINATSYNRVLLLTGEAPTESLRNEVINKMRRIPNVKKIHNEVILAAPSALISRSSDTLITSNVKIALFTVKNLDNFDPTRVKVVTENGVVYLMGLLKPEEAPPVIDVVRRISGVQRVVKLFE